MTAMDPEVLSKPVFSAWLAQRIEASVPTAVVRLGDGEERVLDAELDAPESMRVATLNLEGQSGLRFPPDAVFEVQRAIERAFDEADVLGIAFDYRFDATRINTLTARYLKRVAAGRRPVPLAFCQLHHDVVGELADLLAGRRVSAISSRDLKPVLEGKWGLEDVAVYQVPSEYPARDLDGPYERAMHDVPIWPDRHAELRAELKVRERGEVFLVGAGMWGKDLCIDIRDRGGVALDLGSALDRIVGKITRGPLRRVQILHGDGMPVAEIAADLESRYGAKFDRERIGELIEGGPPHSTGHPHDWRTAGRILTPAAGLEKRGDQLELELAESLRVQRHLDRRLAELDRARAAQLELIQTLEDEVTRTAESRSFRFGHLLARRMPRLPAQRRGHRSGLDVAQERLREARRRLESQAQSR